MKLLLAVGLVMLAGATDATRVDSGIHGKVLIGPTCPVERQGERCIRPYKATLRIRARRSHRLVATVRSGDDGAFRVRLAPGPYVVEPVSGKPYPRAAPVRVRVPPHVYARVTITYDSGIR
jgi:hypothetical protein